jgi:exosome complex RNA-binding protein Rrp42 (RNase PH superfamily)
MQAEAFRKLYPEEFLEKFLGQGVRPDGRGLASAKTFSVHIGPVSNSPGSALVKVGETTVLTSTEVSILDLEHESDTGRIEYELDVGPLGTTFENNSVAKLRQELASVCGRVRRTLSSVVDRRSLSLSDEDAEELEFGNEKSKKYFGWCVRVKSLCLALDG